MMNQASFCKIYRQFGSWGGGPLTIRSHLH